MERGIADISGFLDEVRAHTTKTGNDKYAKDRKYEPADVLTEWFANEPLLWTCCKYLTRLPRTKKKDDFFKALHYLGMQYNLVFGKPLLSPDAESAPSRGPVAQDTFLVTATGQNFGVEFQIEKHTALTPKIFGYFLQCLSIFDARHKVRGTSNVNEIGVEGCLAHVKEKAIRAFAAWKQICTNAELARANGMTLPPRHQDPLWKDFTDSCFDAANFALMALMKARDEWPADRTVQDVGVPA